MRFLRWLGLVMVGGLLGVHLARALTMSTPAPPRDEAGISDIMGFVLHGAPPTCGAGCAAVSGNDRAFDVTTTTLATSVTVNFSKTLASKPICLVGSSASGVTIGVTALSTASVTFGLSVGLTGHLYGLCFQTG